MQNQKINYQFLFVEADISAQFQCQTIRTGAVLCAYKALVTSDAVCGQQSNRYPRDITKHGGGSMWLHVSGS
jgi:hypothetical protein